LLITAGDNPDRLKSQSAWAHFCGVAPIEGASGKITQGRLNRGGDCSANAAWWRIVITRMSNDPRIRVYLARRSDEGRGKGEIIRVLKRYAAIEFDPVLVGK
jgi:transposase